MWLKAKKIDALLKENKITRAELAEEFECSLDFLNRVFDGKEEAGEELSRLIIAAFGAADMCKVIDWRRAAA